MSYDIVSMIARDFPSINAIYKKAPSGDKRIPCGQASFGKVIVCEIIF